MITMLAKIPNFRHVTNNANRRKNEATTQQLAATEIAITTKTTNLKENEKQHSQYTTSRT